MQPERTSDVTPPSDDIPATPGDTLLFENERVRVWSMTLDGDGGTFDYHRHFHDHIVIWPQAGLAQGQLAADDDWGPTQHAEAGFVMFKTVGRSGPLPAHRIRNLRPEANTHYIVELLDPSPSEHEQPWVTNGRGHHVGLPEGASGPAADSGPTDVSDGPADPAGTHH